MRTTSTISRRTLYPARTERHRNIGKPDILDLVRLFWPRAAPHLPMTRIGCVNDGGYVLPITALQCDTVLSIGIGNNVSFDFALAEYGMNILQLDHTIEQTPIHHDNFRFHRYGWSSRSVRSLLSFADIMSLYAKLNPERSILKFDIEGCEFDALAGTDIADLRQFEIIVCEIHGLTDLDQPQFFDQAKGLFEKLGTNHTPIHIHPNNYRGTARIHDVVIPEVLEITYVRSDFGPFAGLADDRIPASSDSPNNPLLPDIELTALQPRTSLAAIVNGSGRTMPQIDHSKHA